MKTRENLSLSPNMKIIIISTLAFMVMQFSVILVQSCNPDANPDTDHTNQDWDYCANEAIVEIDPSSNNSALLEVLKPDHRVRYRGWPVMRFEEQVMRWFENKEEYSSLRSVADMMGSMVSWYKNDTYSELATRFATFYLLTMSYAPNRVLPSVGYIPIWQYLFNEAIKRMSGMMHPKDGYVCHKPRKCTQSEYELVAKAKKREENERKLSGLPYSEFVAETNSSRLTYMLFLLDFMRGAIYCRGCRKCGGTILKIRRNNGGDEDNLEIILDDSLSSRPSKVTGGSECPEDGGDKEASDLFVDLLGILFRQYSKPLQNAKKSWIDLGKYNFP